MRPSCFFVKFYLAFSFPIGFLCCSNSRPWLRLQTTVFTLRCGERLVGHGCAVAKLLRRRRRGIQGWSSFGAGLGGETMDGGGVLEGWRLREGVLLRCWRWFQNPSFYGKRYLFFLSWIKRKDIIKKLKHGVSTKIVSECMFILLIINSLYLSNTDMILLKFIHAKGVRWLQKSLRCALKKNVQMGRGDVWIWWIRRQRIHPTSDPQNWRVFGAGKPDLRHFFGKILCFSALAWRRCPNYRTDWW